MLTQVKTISRQLKVFNKTQPCTYLTNQMKRFNVR